MTDRPDPAQIEFPGGPRAGAPIPTDDIDGIDFITFAKVSAELTRGDPPRAAILRAIGLDDLRWSFIEQGFLLRVATAALRGDTSLAEELNRTFVATQDALGSQEPSRPLDRYARLVAQAESGTPLVEALREEGLTLSEFTQLQRAWTRRLVADDALAATFRGWVHEAKAARTGARDSSP